MAVTQKNGTWYVVFYTGETSPTTGRPKQKWIKCRDIEGVESEPKNKKEAKRAETKFMAAHEPKEYVEPSKMIFTEYLGYWLENWVADEYAPMTEVTYRNATLKFKEFVEASAERAKLPLKKVTKHDLQSFVRFMQKQEMATKTIQNYVAAMRSALAQAVEWEFIPYAPQFKLRIQADNTKPTKVFTVEDIERIFKEMDRLVNESRDAGGFEVYYKRYQWSTIIRVLFLTGARVGEICGLPIVNVDLDTGFTMYIKQIAQYTAKRGVFLKPNPKNKSSERPIPVEGNLLRILKEQIRFQKATMMKNRNFYQDNGLVFAHEDGQPWSPVRVYSFFSKVCKSLGYTHTLHDLRHTFATWQLRDGTNAIDLAFILGHSDPSTTFKTYAHSQDAERRAAMASMDKKILV